MSAPPAPTDDGGCTHFRRKPRSGGRVAVRWRQGDGAEQAGRTANLGAGGAFIETDGPPAPLGSLLALEIELPARPQPLPLSAAVRWVAGGDEAGSAGESGEAGAERGMGVEFVAPSDEALTALAEFVVSLTATFDHDDLE